MGSFAGKRRILLVEQVEVDLKYPE